MAAAGALRPHARLVDEQLVNRHEGNRNSGGAQGSQISAARRTKAARNSYWTVEINARKIDALIRARGYHRLFNFG